MLINTLGKNLNLLARRFAAGWMKFSEVLARINSFLLLTVVFYALLTPLALLYRALNGKKGEFFENRDSGSTFRDDVPDHAPASFEKTW